MNDPYAVLGVAPEADDATIRQRYLELVRQFTPEQHPEKFAAVRAAYEKLKDVDTRVKHRLLEQGRRESIDEIIEELTCRIPRRRYTLQALLNLQKLGTR